MVLIIPVSREINEVYYIESLMIAYESKSTFFKEMRYLPPATKLGQGNIFSSVCQEFCPRGGGGSTWAGTSRAGTPPEQVHPPWADTPPLGRYTPLWVGTPPEQVHPQGRYTPPPGRYIKFRKTYDAIFEKKLHKRFLLVLEKLCPIDRN